MRYKRENLANKRQIQHSNRINKFAKWSDFGFSSHYLGYFGKNSYDTASHAKGWFI
jgi:hypothetical protein